MGSTQAAKAREALNDSMSREMRLLSHLLLATGHGELPEFIALRRRPGRKTWKSWEEIALELREISGEPITRESPRRWAERLGISRETRMYDGPELMRQYAAEIKRLKIKL